MTYNVFSGTLNPTHSLTEAKVKFQWVGSDVGEPV